MLFRSIHAFSGYKVQGKSEDAAKKIIEDAQLLEKCGVFAIVLECIPEKLAKIITEKISIPTIGIGAGKECDGQILVTQDMFNMFGDFKPKFVKQYANVGDIIREGVENYIGEVKDKKFPDENHSFKIDENTLKKLY